MIVVLKFKKKQTLNIDTKPPEARGDKWDRFLLEDTKDNLTFPKPWSQAS